MLAMFIRTLALPQGASQDTGLWPVCRWAAVSIRQPCLSPPSPTSGLALREIHQENSKENFPIRERQPLARLAGPAFPGLRFLGRGWQRVLWNLPGHRPVLGDARGWTGRNVLHLPLGRCISGFPVHFDPALPCEASRKSTSTEHHMLRPSTCICWGWGEILEAWVGMAWAGLK